MSVHQQIQARIQAFAVELEALVRAAAIEAVATSLGAAAGAPPARHQPSAGVRTRPAPGAPPPTSTAGHAALSFKRKKGKKRTPEQLAKIDGAIVGFVKENPGQGVEHMAKALGVPSNDIKLRVSLLLDGRKLKKTGVKRATKYFLA